jgi:predicted Zn-dependent peptidase
VIGETLRRYLFWISCSLNKEIFVTIVQKRLSNGLSVIIEEMDHVESASYDLVIPGGFVCDAPGHLGASSVLAELIGKGAGSLNSRELSEAFDGAGIRHGEGAGMDRFTLSGSMVAPKMERALELVSQIIMHPHLPENDIEPIQSIMLQDIEALKDNPARRAMVELTKRFYPAPYNRSSLGEVEGIRSVTRAMMVELHSRFFRPQGAILSIAGKVRADSLLKAIEELFASWEGAGVELPVFGGRPPHDYHHITDDSAQMQVVLASPSVKFGEKFYYEAKIATSILGASMFGRLFVELREKRGLCYSVYARHGASNLYGTTSAYVGTTPERAQESLDLLLGEFERLPGSITQEELDRSRTNLKASLVMGEESPGARAGSNATDWWLLKRVRSLAEINEQIDKVSIDSLNEFLRAFPYAPCSVLTLGRAPLVCAERVVGK